LFRIKIVLLSILISGSVLIVFGLYFLDVIHDVSLDRIDREIRTLGEGQLHVWLPRRHWVELDKSLRFIYGDERWKDIIVRVKDASNEILYRSPHWPGGISEDIFPGYDRKMEVLSLFPDNFPGKGQPFNSKIGRPLDSADAADPSGRGASEEKKKPPRPHRFGQLPDWPGDNPFAGITPPDLPPFPPFPPPPTRIKQPFFKTLKTDQGVWRIGIMGNKYVTILLGMEMAGFYADAARFKKTFLITVPIALLLLAGGGWLITYRALKPIVLITRTAESITAQGLDRRIPLSAGGDTEFSMLVAVINSMLDRLEKSFKQAVRFSADAAHELKTPLTILQGVLDDAVQHAAIGSDEQRFYGTLIEEVQRLKAIVLKLLILAHADAGQLALNLEPLDISAVIESAIEDVVAIAPNLCLKQQIAPQVTVQADPDLFKQVIQNLTSNAVKYNTEGGLIRFQLEVRGDKVLFTISNTGAPIPEADREKIFHRFYRVDKSHSYAIPGSGLGLSLAREIVHAHKGTLCLNADSGNLISFTLSLPRNLM